MLDFAPTTSLAGSGEKLGTGPCIGQPTRCGLCQETFFSGAVSLLNSVDDSWKVVPYGDHPQEAYAGRTWTGVGSVRGVLVEFFPAGYTSIRITATLGYE
jgi:hypothetical protein